MMSWLNTELLLFLLSSLASGVWVYCLSRKLVDLTIHQSRLREQLVDHLNGILQRIDDKDSLDNARIAHLKDLINQNTQDMILSINNSANRAINEHCTALHTHFDHLFNQHQDLIRSLEALHVKQDTEQCSQLAHQNELTQIRDSYRLLADDFRTSLLGLAGAFEQAEERKLNVVHEFRRELTNVPALKIHQEIKSIHDQFKQDVCFFLTYIKGFDMVRMQEIVEQTEIKVDQLRTETNKNLADLVAKKVHIRL